LATRLLAKQPGGHWRPGQQFTNSWTAYSWVFVLGDVLSGLVITVAAYFIYMISQQRDQLTVLMIGGYLCFGVLTAISALLPLHCGTNPSQCAVNNFQPLGIHDAIGGVASFGQFISFNSRLAA